MAYQGGYAGGYADTIVPPAPADQGTGYKIQHPTYQQTTRHATRTRYRLTIIGWGVIEHTDPQLVTVATAGDRTQHRSERFATGRIDATVEQNHTSRAAYRAQPASKGTIPDPDEWLVFL